MQSTKQTSKAVARLQNGLPFWPQKASENLNLDEVSKRSGCTRRQIRHLIQLGLVDAAGKVGSRDSYGQHHVEQARSVYRLKNEGKYSLNELSWLQSQDALHALDSAEGLAPLEFLLKLAQSLGKYANDAAGIPPSCSRSPFEKRLLIAIESAIKESILTERRLINEVHEALNTK